MNKKAPQLSALPLFQMPNPLPQSSQKKDIGCLCGQQQKKAF